MRSSWFFSLFPVYFYSFQKPATTFISTLTEWRYYEWFASGWEDEDDVLRHDEGRFLCILFSLDPSDRGDPFTSLVLHLIILFLITVRAQTMTSHKTDNAAWLPFALLALYLNGSSLCVIKPQDVLEWRAFAKADVYTPTWELFIDS